MNHTVKYYKIFGEVSDVNIQDAHYNHHDTAFSNNQERDLKKYTKELINHLNKNMYSIEEKIKYKIHRELPSTLEIQIDMQFKHGSILWFGAIEIVSEIINGMAIAGGAISFIKIIRDSIDSVLKDNIKLFDSQLKIKYLNIYTEIDMISSSNTSAQEEKILLYDVEQAILNSNIYKVGKGLISFFITIIILALFGGTYYNSSQISSLAEQAEKSKLEISKITTSTISSIEDSLNNFENFIKTNNLNNAEEKYETMLKEVKEKSEEAKKHITTLEKQFKIDFVEVQNELNNTNKATSTYISEEKLLIKEYVQDVEKISIIAKSDILSLKKESTKILDTSKVYDINGTKIELKKIQIQIEFIKNNLYKFFAVFTSLVLLILFLALWIKRLKKDNKTLERNSLP